MDWRGGQKSRHQVKAVDAVKRRQKSHFADVKRRQPSNQTRLHNNFVPSWLCSKNTSNVSPNRMQTQLDRYQPFKPVVDRLSAMTRRARHRNSKQFASPSLQPGDLETLNAQCAAQGIINSPPQRYTREGVSHLAHYDETMTPAGEASTTVQHIDLDSHRLEDAERSSKQEGNLTRYMFDRKELLQIPDWAGLALAKPARFSFDENGDRAAIGKRRRVTKDDRARRDGHDTRRHVPAVQERCCKSDSFCADDELYGRNPNRDSIHKPLSIVTPKCREILTENASQLAKQQRSSPCEWRGAAPTTQHKFSAEVTAISHRTGYSTFPTNPFDLSDLMSDAGKEVNLKIQDVCRHRGHPYIETSPPPIACVAADGVPKLVICSTTPAGSSIESPTSDTSNEEPAESLTSPTNVRIPVQSTVRNVEDGVAVNFTQDLGSDLEEYLLKDLQARQNATLHAYVESPSGCQTDSDMALETLPRTPEGMDAGLDEIELDHRRERSYRVATPPRHDSASLSNNDTVARQVAHRSNSGIAPRATGGGKPSRSFLRVCDGFM